MDKPTNDTPTYPNDTPLIIKWTDTVTTEYRYRTTTGRLLAALTASGRDPGDYIDDDGSLNLAALRGGAEPRDAWDKVLADNIGPELADETHVDTEREVTSVAVGN